MKKRLIIASLVFWSFVNLLVLVWSFFGKFYYFRGDSHRGSMFGDLNNNYISFLGNKTDDPLELIFPFNSYDYRAYDITEFMIYSITPALIFFLYQYVTNKKGS